MPPNLFLLCPVVLLFLSSYEWSFKVKKKEEERKYLQYPSSADTI